MIDFVPLMDWFGEAQTLALGAFALAFTFGLLAERSGFCTRSAVREVIDRKAGTALSVWLAALGTAIIAAQWAIGSGHVMPEESRYFAASYSLSGPVLGGILFGIGMALARGCTSRLIILGAGGNVRAVTTVAVLGLVAVATISGFLVPVRDALSGLYRGETAAVVDHAGSSGFGVTIGLVLLAGSAAVAIIRKVQIWKALAGVGIGLIVAGGWWFTSTLAQQVFDPIAVESLSFIRPTATVAGGAMSGGFDPFSMDIGLFAGIIVGAAAATLTFGKFRIQRFSDEGAPHFSRYLLGGALMGFGGVLAGGCTVGAGFSGGSVLALPALLALVGMMVASGATDLVLRILSDREQAGVLQPAE